MLDLLEPALKIICAVLAALLLYQLARLAVHRNPLARLTIPALPVLAADTNAPPGGNATNTLAARTPAEPATNSLHSNPRTASKGTNVAPSQPSASGGTNLAADKALGQKQTNSAALVASGKRETKAGPPPGMAMNAMNPFGGQAAMKPADLAPAVLARVDKITDSEILGPIIRPLPMALLGIAGNVAFLRATNGQTGLVKEGDELSGIKLLRIGTNRVLVEQDGEKKELTIFSGYGSESLLPKPKEHSP